MSVKAEMIEVPLRGDAQDAAERLRSALNDAVDAGFTTPRIAGEIEFPRVRFWRSRGGRSRSPYAQFEGEIRDVSGGTVLVGRIVAPASGSLMGDAIVVPPAFLALVALGVGIFSRSALGVLAAVGFVLLMAAYVGLVRRFGKMGRQAEADMLLQEIRDLAS